MKSFRDYLKEDVVPTAIVQDGSIDLEREVVRAQINSSLASVLADPSVTPYNALVRASKVLSYFSIILPKRVYLDGEKGIEAIELRQFGDRMGMTDQGEFIKEVPGKFYLFIQYWRTHPNVVPYAAAANFISSTGGMFKVAAKVVDKVELDRLIDMAEVSLSEGAEDRQALAKAKAPKEDMHTALGDCDCSQGDSPSTKKAIKVSMKKIDEAMTRKQKDMAVRRFMSHDPDAGERILKMGKKEREEKKSFASAKKEIKRLKEDEQIDELKKSTLGSYIKKAHVSGLEAASQGEIAYARKDKEGLRAANKTGEKREQGIERAANKLAKEETMKESRMPASVIKHKQKLASMSPEELKKKFAGKSEEHLKSMARRHGYGKDSDVYSKHIKEDNLDEAMGSVKKSYAYKKMKTKVSTVVRRGLGKKRNTNTILVTNKGDPHAVSGGGVHRIPKDKYDPSKHNLASE